MGTDQVEQLDFSSVQSAKVLHKGKEAEERDASAMSNIDNRIPSPLDSQGIQTSIVMAGKKDAE